MTDPAVLHASYSLADYPLLSRLAARVTHATRLDGRACLHLYLSSLDSIDLTGVSRAELDFMRRLGIPI
jgi:hypothetical protein